MAVAVGKSYVLRKSVASMMKPFDQISTKLPCLLQKRGAKSRNLPAGLAMPINVLSGGVWLWRVELIRVDDVNVELVVRHSIQIKLKSVQ